MPPRDWRLRIEDMIDAIAAIESYVQAMNFAAFSRDQKTIDAVIRQFEVLGEAARHVPEEIQRRSPEVPWARVRGLRHVLAHEYFGVDAEILWKTASQELQPLRAALGRLLAEVKGAES